MNLTKINNAMKQIESEKREREANNYWKKAMKELNIGRLKNQDN